MKRLQRLLWRLKLRWLNKTFHRRPYLDAYAERTDALAMFDPEIAIGGLWDEMGRRQFEFLKEQGLDTASTLLDIGCGTLRGGRHFIAYLDERKYFGFDISENAIGKARELIANEGLADKSPRVEVNWGKNLRFQQYEGKQFDFVLAQSVFSHLQKEHIEEAFAHLPNVMSASSQFFFTFHEGTEYRRRDATNFEYPISFFEGLARRYGMELENMTARYQHPRGQVMARVKRLAT